MKEYLGKPMEEYVQKYREVRILGTGGFGKVMLVRDEEDKYFAAKKQLFDGAFKNAKKELQVLQKLHHPNICNFVEGYYGHVAGSSENRLVIILEFCPCKLSLL